MNMVFIDKVKGVNHRIMTRLEAEFVILRLAPNTEAIIFYNVVSREQFKNSWLESPTTLPRF